MSVMYLASPYSHENPAVQELRYLAVGENVARMLSVSGTPAQDSTTEAKPAQAQTALARRGRYY